MDRTAPRTRGCWMHPLPRRSPLAALTIVRRAPFGLSSPLLFLERCGEFTELAGKLQTFAKWKLMSFHVEQHARTPQLSSKFLAAIPLKLPTGCRTYSLSSTEKATRESGLRNDRQLSLALGESQVAVGKTIRGKPCNRAAFLFLGSDLGGRALLGRSHPKATPLWRKITPISGGGR